MGKYIKNCKISSKVHLNNVLFILFVILTLICGYYLFVNQENNVVAKSIEKVETNTMKKKKNKTVKVDVKGAVNNPGVYELPSGSRVVDAVNMAGGMTESANTSIINLSKILKDGFVIVIYTDKDLTDIVMDKYVKNNLACPSTINDACIVEDNMVTTNNTNNKSSASNESNTKQISNSKTTTTKQNTNKNTTNSIVNLNTATIDELQTLSGIGESKAQAIISYREENGSFKSIDELTNVPGIGASTLEKIKDNITI